MNIKKNTLTILILLVIGLFTTKVIAQGNDSKVIWSCKKQYTQENILWLVEWGHQSYIKVFDERIPAKYTMDGLEKRWNWGLDKEDYTYSYAITLGPDRTALYYNFTTSKDGTAKSKDSYKCKK